MSGEEGRVRNAPDFAEEGDADSWEEGEGEDEWGKVGPTTEADKRDERSLCEQAGRKTYVSPKWIVRLRGSVPMLVSQGGDMTVGTSSI